MSRTILIALMTLIFLPFQNCAKMESQQSSSSSELGTPGGGDTYVPTPSPDLPADYTPAVSKDLKADFQGVCNGTADDAPAFQRFNAWAQTWQAMNSGLIELKISGTCTFLTNPWFAKDIRKLIVVGTGTAPTLMAPTGKGFMLGARGQYQDNKHSSRLETVNAGATKVKLKTPSEISRFTVGQYALVTGFDLQGLWNAPYGFPSNPHFFEYVKVLKVDVATGEVTFADPLKNTYLSTWPNYNGGNQFEIDNGGPATLYALDPSWDLQIEYRNLTISQDGQSYANGRDVTYRDVKFTGGNCGIPTQNVVWRAINTDMSGCHMEVDKLINEVVFDKVTIAGIAFQSSSIDLLTMKNTTVTKYLNGTAKRALISDTKMASFRPGAYAYGRSDETICTNCELAAITAGGVMEKGPQDVGASAAYTAGPNLIRLPNSMGAPRWAVPGTNLMWWGRYADSSFFQVTDVTQDANFTYVHTNGGGPPKVAGDTSTYNLRTHPAPKFSCINCTGSADAIDLAQAPKGAPMYSYTKRVYTGTDSGGTAKGAPAWGRLVTAKYNVTKPYTGSLANLNLNMLGQFGAFLLHADNTVSRPDPRLNLKIAGERVLAPSGASGGQTGDVFSVSADQANFPFKSYDAKFTQYGIWMSNIANEPQAVWPSITVEYVTEQNVR